jgi:hypothetical protein
MHVPRQRATFSIDGGGGDGVDLGPTCSSAGTVDQHNPDKLDLIRDVRHVHVNDHRFNTSTKVILVGTVEDVVVYKSIQPERDDRIVAVVRATAFAVVVIVAVVATVPCCFFCFPLLFEDCGTPPARAGWRVRASDPRKGSKEWQPGTRNVQPQTRHERKKVQAANEQR